MDTRKSMIYPSTQTIAGDFCSVFCSKSRVFCVPYIAVWLHWLQDLWSFYFILHIRSNYNVSKLLVIQVSYFNSNVLSYSVT